MQSWLIIESSHSDLLFSTVFLACENIHFSSLFTAGDVLHGATSATQRQKFHNDDANQCLHNKFGSHWVPINLSNFTCLLVSFGKVSCSSADELHQNSNASSREDYIAQTLTVLLEINSILCIYIWPLWPFVFCPSFVNNSLNNVPTLSTNQCFWLDSRQILRHQYGISVTELQPFFRAKRRQQQRASRNGPMFLQTTVFQGLLVRSLCISQFQVQPCTPWATARHLIACLVSPQILHGLEVRHLPIPGPPPSSCHKHGFLSKHNWTWRIIWVVI